MRILSLNAWGGALSEVLHDWLASSNADVVCLQEVTRTAGLHGWTTFSDGERTLPQRADLFADVMEALLGYRATSAHRTQGRSRTRVARGGQQEFGIATFVSERV